MADPPPPSYDEAITGNFSAPPPPSSPPPSFISPPPPETSTTLPPFSLIPSSECFSEIPSRLNGGSTEPLNSGHHYARRTSNINNFHTSYPYEDASTTLPAGPGSNKVCKKMACVIAIFGVVLATVLYFVVPSNQSGDNCKSDPLDRTIRPELRLTQCPKNEKGEYEHGSKCVLECKNDLFMHVYNHHGYPKKRFTPPHYFCYKAKWEYYAPENNLNFQCLPLSKSTQDCELKDLTKEISGSTRPELIDCPQKLYHGYNKNNYFTGTKCTLKCPTDYIMFVQNSDNKLKEGPQSVNFTCQNSTWVATNNVQYKNKQCLKKMSSKYDCGNTLGVTLKNCHENHRGAYFLGTKCNIECEENYSLYAYGNNSLLYYNTKAVLEPINAKLQVTCEKISFSRRKSKWKATLDDGTRFEDKRFQCLPPSNASSDCPKWPPWFSDIKLKSNMFSGRFYCPINDRGQYSEGTVCTWQCHKGNYLYNSNLKTSNLPTKMSNFHYTCNHSQWVSSLSKEFRKGYLYCIDF